MRVDNYRQGYDLNIKRSPVSNEGSETNYKEETIKGRIIDVNKDMILVQISDGKQLFAKSTIPMENFVNQEMIFDLITTSQGEILLRPQIDQKKQNTIIDLKIQDILSKLGENESKDNKDLIKEMIKTSIPITKENFTEIKELKFALNTLKGTDFSIKPEDGDEYKNLNELMKQIQFKKDLGIAKQSDYPIINKEASLKDILLLKNLNLKINLSNIKSLYDIFENLDLKKNYIVGINDLLSDESFYEKLKKDVKNVNTSLDLSIIKDGDGIEDIISKDKNILFEVAEDLSFKEMEKLNKIFIKEMSANNEVEKELSDINQDTKNIREDMKLDAEDIKSIINNIEKNLTKKLSSLTNEEKKLKLDYNLIKDDIKTINNILGKDSEVVKLIEKQISPKVDILNGMNERYNYNIIPFKLGENYENTIEYYVKKNKKKIQKKDDINVGLSLDTKRYGNVKTMINYNKEKSLKLEFFTQNTQVKTVFDDNLVKLKEVLKKLGFSSVDMKVSVNKSEEKRLLDNVLYENEKLETLELWV